MGTLHIAFMWLQITVEVMMLWTDDEEVDQSSPGENLKLKLKNVEEDDVSPGFVLCTPNNLCHTGRIFDAQVKKLMMLYFFIAAHIV